MAPEPTNPSTLFAVLFAPARTMVAFPPHTPETVATTLIPGRVWVPFRDKIEASALSPKLGAPMTDPPPSSGSADCYVAPGLLGTTKLAIEAALGDTATSDGRQSVLRARLGLYLGGVDVC
jgi:hypothetical protein